MRLNWRHSYIQAHGSCILLSAAHNHYQGSYFKCCVIGWSALAGPRASIRWTRSAQRFPPHHFANTVVYMMWVLPLVWTLSATKPRVASSLVPGNLSWVHFIYNLCRAARQMSLKSEPGSFFLPLTRSTAKCTSDTGKWKALFILYSGLFLPWRFSVVDSVETGSKLFPPAFPVKTGSLELREKSSLLI